MESPLAITSEDGRYVVIGGDATSQRQIASVFMREEANILLEDAGGQDNPMAEQFTKICCQLSKVLHKIREYKDQFLERTTMGFSYSGPSSFMLELGAIHKSNIRLITNAGVYLDELDGLKKSSKKGKTVTNQGWYLMMCGFARVAGALFFLGHRWFSGLVAVTGGVTHFGGNKTTTMFEKESTLFKKAKFFTLSVISNATLINTKITAVNSSFQELETIYCSLGTGESLKSQLRRVVEETLHCVDDCATAIQVGKADVATKFGDM